MRKTLLLVLTATLVSCNIVHPHPTDHTLESQAITFVKWSDPATWGGKVPVAGDTVTIPAGKAVLLDVSPPALRGVEVNGMLSFDPALNLMLKTDYLMVMGALQVGTEAAPIQGKAEIVLTSNNLADNIHSMGAKVLGAMGGGTIDIHGQPTLRSWTKLNGTVAVGSKTITVQDPVNWKVGDAIIITSSSFYNPYSPKSQTEQRLITAISGNTLTLNQGLTYGHWGADAAGVNEQAEVGLLSRNVLIHSDDSVLDTTTPAGSISKGGHLMAMVGSKVRIENAEFRDMGQKSVFGRYPIHFHQLSDGGLGSYVRNNSIWRTYNRCVVIHGTNKLILENNVMYNSTGHCVYFEEGTETGNTIRNNVVAYVKALKDAARLIPTDDRPAAYWITRPGNYLSGNSASEAHIGYWYALPEKPIPFGRGTQDLAWMDSIYPRREALGYFDSNVAHSNWQGLFVDGAIASTLCDGTMSRNTCKDHSNLSLLKDAGAVNYAPRQKPAQDYNFTSTDAAVLNLPVVASFNNFTAYKHRNQAVWLRGSYQQLNKPRMADNKIGAIFAASRVYLNYGLVVGSTPNTLGDAADIEPRTGFQFYDGHVGVRNTLFRNFTTPQSAALGYLRHTSFSLVAQNYASGLTFENSNRVYLDTPPAPVFNATTEDSKDGYRGAVFYDHDGSVTGATDTYVTVNHPFLTNSSCSFKTEWNAYTCRNTYLNLGLRILDTTEVTTPTAPYKVLRSDGPSIDLWGTPNGVGTPNNSFQTRLIATRGGTVPRYVYQLQSGTGAVPTKYLASLTLDSLPTDALFIKTVPTASAANSWVELVLPFNGPAYVYRTYYFGYNSGKGLNKVAIRSDLYKGTMGDTYYQDAAGIHVIFTFRDLTTSQFTSFHVCQTLKCE
ncbi:G8 domain-containing protein [Deinococcus roseus]|uniref:G8 domain-containing protein n=1 Tax=Deinococcus roseus TaxID=392414 RepID=A0ABQ2D072_9DEIO|nr:G8 domain-containing protein [Deinococcus roseus]GGJ38048.1 hypothetical protein GCM10008938_25190 [Deinococcus roseus]